MRPRTIVLALVLASVASACSLVEGDDASTSSDAYTAPRELDDDLLARGSLYVLGASPRRTGNSTRPWLSDQEKEKLGVAEGSCSHCHDINATTLTSWAKSYGKALDALAAGDTSKLLRDPSNPESGYAPSKAGLLAVGAHLNAPPSPQGRAVQPHITEQAGLVERAFEGKPEELERFRTDLKMPIEGHYGRLMWGAYEMLAEWAQRGQCRGGACVLPKATELLPEADRPTSCTDDVSRLRAHLDALRGSNPPYRTWDKINKENRALMFGCGPDAGSDASKCLSSYPSAPEWVDPQAAGSTVRRMRELDIATFFWMRTSADGRFVANGGSGQNAHITDLQTGKNMVAKASYDPDFSPSASVSDSWFMFQGTAAGGGRRCPLTLLSRNPDTIQFNEPGCVQLEGVSLYQTVGQTVGDNSLSDFFIVNSKFASDNPGLTVEDQDLKLTAGREAAVKIVVGVSNGTDGYDFLPPREFSTPYEGDTMMARSGHLIGSRLATDGGAEGYVVRKLDYKKVGDGYSITKPEQLGTICMPGNKANFSFDERFLATHHYLTDAERRASSFPAGKGASDIYVADLMTGKKIKVTKMKPDQFALYPHFRSDGWLYFLVRDKNGKEYIAASDIAIQIAKDASAPPAPPPPPGGGGGNY